MLPLRQLLPIIYAAILVNEASCANILIIMHFVSKSLHLGGMAMSDILVERGHNVTLVSAYKAENSRHFQHVYLSDVIGALDSSSGDVNYFDLHMNPYKQIYEYTAISLEVCKRTFQDKNFKKLLASKQKFDLVIVEAIRCNSLFYVSEIFNAPLVLYTSVFPSSLSNPPVGNPSPPSYIPHEMSHYTADMTFFERLDNSFRHLLEEVLLHGFALPAEDQIVKENFPNAPHISTYYNKASLVLLNSDPSVAYPIPKVPGMIEIGGFHIRPPKVLPKDLQSVIDGAKNGVVYFNMGSNLKSSQMSPETVQAILNVLGRLKETVLWKWEDENLPGKPDNVVIRKWMPQNEILAQKNIKLFITHGGFHGMLETVFYGIPCVSLSVFADQMTNSRRGVDFGFMEWLKFQDFTEEKFERAIRRVLDDPKYKAAAVKRSKILRDTPLPSKADLLNFWVEYAIRNNGAEYLKVASLKLKWYQYLLLDVVGFIILCVLSASLFLRFVVSKLLCSCRKSVIKVKSS